MSLSRLCRDRKVWNIANTVAAFVVFGAHIAVLVGQSSKNPEIYHTDFAKLYAFAERVAGGAEPYPANDEIRAGLDRGGYINDIDRYMDWCPYPPVVGALLSPLTAIGYPAASLAWAGVNTAFAVAGAWLCAAALRPAALWLPIVLMSLTLLLWPSRFNSVLGNTEFVVLFLFAAGLYALMRRRDRWAGAAIGAAAAVKVYPAFLIAALVLRGRWTAVATSVCTLAGLTLAGVIWVGWDSWPAFLEAAGLKAHPHLLGWGFNQTLTGILHRQWGFNAPQNVFATAAHRPELVHFLTLSGSAAILLMYLAAAWIARHRNDRTAAWFGLAVVTAILLSPHAEPYYVAALLPAVAVAINESADGRRFPRIALWVGLAVALHLMGLRESNWKKEYKMRFDAEYTILNNLWLSRVWLGSLALWLLLLCMSLQGRKAPAKPA